MATSLQPLPRTKNCAGQFRRRAPLPRYPYGGGIRSHARHACGFPGAKHTPEDIVTASRLAGVVAVVIGLSASSDAGQSITRLEEIRKQLPDELIAVMGGNETIATVEGVVTISTFRDFDDWLDRFPV